MNTKQDILTFLTSSSDKDEDAICRELAQKIQSLSLNHHTITPDKWRKFSIRRMLGSGTLSSSNETHNWDEVNKFIHQKISMGESPTFQSAQEINKILYPKNLGSVRQGFSHGSDTQYLHPELIIEFINEFEVFLFKATKVNSCEEALFHAFLCYSWGCSIHPFEDGNGRTFRSLADWILMQNNILPATFGNAVQARVAVAMNVSIPKRSKLLENYLQGVLNSYEFLYEEELYCDCELSQ